jgi:predicted RNase H-like HicB family nuclease
MRLKIVYEPSEDGGFTVYVPALPGCISEGHSLEEARHNIMEAIQLYLEPDGQESLPKGAVIEEVSV